MLVCLFLPISITRRISWRIVVMNVDITNSGGCPSIDVIFVDFFNQFQSFLFILKPTETNLLSQIQFLLFLKFLPNRFEVPTKVEVQLYLDSNFVYLRFQKNFHSFLSFYLIEFYFTWSCLSWMFFLSWSVWRRFFFILCFQFQFSCDFPSVWFHFLSKKISQKQKQK